MRREELVEKIYHELSSVSWAFQREDAEGLITLIGEAFVDGLALPNELGRGTMEKRHEGSHRIEREFWVGEITAYPYHKEPPKFIAFNVEKENE